MFIIKINIELYKIDHKHSLRTLKNNCLKNNVEDQFILKNVDGFHLFNAVG